MLMNINKIKPDPDQPRRTFNEEKMEALRASMMADGFRSQYPIIINGGNTIVDGERRWRAAKAIGIKEVPVEKKAHVTPAERLLYQLQSEGAEIELIDRNRAWVRLWELSKDFDSKASLSRKIGVNETTFKRTIEDYYAYESAVAQIKDKTVVTTDYYGTLTEIGREKDPEIKKKLAKKATKEKWTQEKAREIRRTIKEKPTRIKQILSQDYSDPYEGSNQWKLKLDVAKSDIDIQALEDMRVTREKMFHQVDKWDQLTGAVINLRTAIQEFDFKLAPPEIRVKLHRIITNVLPELTGYKENLETYMLENGELEVANKLEA